jgi:hypothetical protein
MYDLPDDFDPEEFVGHELEQVSFTANTVHLAFDGEASVTILGAFEVSAPGDSGVTRQAPPLMESNVMALLGRKVVSARMAERRTVIFEFDGGGKLTCMDDMPAYEAYTIRIGSKEIVV